MNNNFRNTLLALGLLAAGFAQAASNGNIMSLTASTLKPKVGEQISITVNGSLTPGKSCHIAGGTVSPYKDLGLISSMPVTLPQTFSFDTPGPHYIFVYPGTTDPDNLCTQSGPNSVKVDVGAAGGNISAITPSTMMPKVNEQISVKLEGTLDPGKKCHVYGGIKSPYMDLGLISSFPHTLSNTFAFDTVGPHFIHVYVGTVDKENVCTVTATSPVKVDVVQAPVRMNPSMPPILIPAPKIPK